jgi:hypothetical protein
MAGTIVADNIRADSTSTLVLKNGVANTPPTIQDSAGTQIGTFCRAWVNFNGTTNVGGFCTIRASFNVTSVADGGTGDYTINFTNALPDADYAVSYTRSNVSVVPTGTRSHYTISGSQTTTSVRIAANANHNPTTAEDVTDASVAIFR